MPTRLTLPEILAEPDSLRLTAQTLCDSPFFTSDLLALCSKNAVERSILTGEGTSFYALHSLNIRLTSAGHFCQMVPKLAGIEQILLTGCGSLSATSKRSRRAPSSAFVLATR